MRLTIGGDSYGFADAIRSGNYDHVEHILSSEWYDVQEINYLICESSPEKYNIDSNLFAHACKNNAKIAFLLLDSDKVLPSSINDIRYTNHHPFINLYYNNDMTLTRKDRIGYFERAIQSDKFLKDCTEKDISQIFHSFLACAGRPDLTRVALKHEKLTRAMIESWKFNGMRTVIEWHSECLTATGESLQVLLDSDKITQEYAFKSCSQIMIPLCYADVRQVLNTHEKLPFVHAHRREIARIDPEITRVGSEIASVQMKITRAELESKICETKMQFYKCKIKLLEHGYEYGHGFL